MHSYKSVPLPGKEPKELIRTNVKTYRHKVGKNRYLILQIIQSANAKAKLGNALASNAYETSEQAPPLEKWKKRRSRHSDGYLPKILRQSGEAHPSPLFLY